MASLTQAQVARCGWNSTSIPSKEQQQYSESFHYPDTNWFEWIAKERK